MFCIYIKIIFSYVALGNWFLGRAITQAVGGDARFDSKSACV